MTIERVRALRGPNIWSRRPAVEAEVVLEEDEEDAWGLPGFHERLVAAMPFLPPWPPAGEQSWSLAHVLGQVALALEASAGCPVSFSRASPAVAPLTHLVTVEYSEEAVGRLALQEALALCRAVRAGEACDVAAMVRRLRSLDEDVRLGPSTGSIVRAALDRGIPILRLNDESLVQFGWGARRRLIQAAETDRTSAIAEGIAQDKDLTKRLLGAVGVPVPAGRPVADEEDALEAAADLGYPVVVKPRHGNQGRGVTTEVRDPEDLRLAYRAAREVEREVLVERHVPGDDYRLLVVGGRVVAAARRDPPEVVGDGRRTIRQLVEEVNADPRRTEGHATSLSRIRLDDVAIAFLARHGWTPDSVPGAGQRVRLRGNANLSTGGTATDVTDRVHPEVARAAVEAARIVGLDVCGVDLVCGRIDRPLDEQDGAVVEVNAAPGLRMHLDPSEGTPRPVGRAIVDLLFPPGETGRIPLVTVTGTNGKTTTIRLVAHILTRTGRTVGMTCSDGIYVGGRRIEVGDCSGPRSARAILQNPVVEAAVLESARGGILREGLAFDRVDVAVVTNIGTGDHLGLNYLRSVEELSVLKRVVVQNVAPDGYAVLNAADPHVAPMALVCPGRVAFFARDREHPVLAGHIARGGRGLFVERGDLVAVEGTFERRVPLARVPLTQGGALRFQTENVLAAVGAAWGLGVAWEVIEDVLSSFCSDSKTTPGRFNVYSFPHAPPAPGPRPPADGATIIADYGHNPDAIAALVEAADAFPARRRLVMLSGAGDRRDCDLMAMARILGDAFDEVILYEDACNRGRKDGEVLRILRQGLEGAVRAKAVTEVRGEFNAIELSVNRLRAGDLGLLLIDQVDEAVAFLEALLARAPRKAA